MASESGTTSTFNWGSGGIDAKGGSNANASYTQKSGAWSPPSVFRTKNFALEVNAVGVGPGLCVSNLAANGTATITASDLPPMGSAIVAFSGTGAGPIPTIWGNLLLAPPLFLLPTLQANATGVAKLNLKVPTGVTGVKVWFHALELSNSKLTNGLAETIQ